MESDEERRHIKYLKISKIPFVNERDGERLEDGAVDTGSIKIFKIRLLFLSLTSLFLSLYMSAMHVDLIVRYLLS